MSYINHLLVKGDALTSIRSTEGCYFMSTTTAQHFDSLALQLIKSEIDASLLQVQNALSVYVDDNSNTFGLTEAAEGLAQVHGILRLLEVTGGIELAEANFMLLNHILQGNHQTNNQQLSALGEGLMMLSRYLEFVVLRENLLPHFLLPSINRIRNELNLPMLREGYFLEPYLNIIQMPKLQLNVQGAEITPAQTQQLAILYKSSLSRILAKKQNSLDFNAIKLVSHFTSMLAAQMPSELYWYAVDAAMTDIDECQLSDARLRTLIQIERNLQKFVSDTQGFTPSMQDMADILTFSACRDHQRANELRQQLGLSDYLLSDAQSELLSRYLFGPDSNTIHVTTHLMQQEINEIKNKIDIMQHGDSAETSFDPLSGHISELANGLSLLNLGEAATLLTYQSNEVKRWKDLSNSEDVNNLMDALLYAGNAVTVLDRSYQAGANNMPFHNLHIALNQIEEARGVLIKESRETINMSIRSLASYLETGDLLHMTNAPAMFDSVSGALLFLEAGEARVMLKKAARFVEQNFIPEKNPPTKHDIDLLANIMITVDYYLESLELQKPLGIHPFQVGTRSADQLKAA